MFVTKVKENIVVVIICAVIALVGGGIAVVETNKKNCIVYKPHTTKIIGIGVGNEYDTKHPREDGWLYDKQFLRVRYLNSLLKVASDKNVVFVLIPFDKRQIDKIANLVDGMLFIGGDDIDPKYFGQKKDEKNIDLESDEKVEFDMALIKKLMKQNKPILGICLGAQELNVAFGGDIIQDIPSKIIDSKVKHSGITAKQLAHSVKIDKNSLLYRILGKEEVLVNSGHHQAIDRVADKFVATAIAPDGVVEAIECKDCNNFVLGVQWHPEFLVSKDDEKIFQAFCDSVIDGNK